MSFNGIEYHIFQFHSKSCLSIAFKIIFSSMKFYYNIIYKTALYLAIEKENIEIIKLLLSKNNLDINHINIFNIFLI